MPLERFRLAAALPPEDGWRLELVLDTTVAPARPVVLARVPPAITGDAVALTALMREVERAVRVVHPSLQPVRGLADAGGLAVLCDWREGERLGALLEAGGPLPAPLAARVLLEVAEALQAIHGGGAAHGDVRADRVQICEDGAVLLTGLGRCASAQASPEADLDGLARLAAAAMGASPGQGEVAAAVVAATAHPTAGEAAAALRGIGPAAAAEVATWLEATLPADGAARSARRLALSKARRPPAPVTPAAERPALSPPPLPSGLRAVAPRALVPAPRAGAAPAAAMSPEASTGAARPAPGRPQPTVRSAGQGRLDDPRLPLVVGAALALVGLAIGLWLGR